MPGITSSELASQLLFPFVLASLSAFAILSASLAAFLAAAFSAFAIFSASLAAFFAASFSAFVVFLASVLSRFPGLVYLRTRSSQSVCNDHPKKPKPHQMADEVQKPP